MNRQALVLHRYYELLEDAIHQYQTVGTPYLVTSIGAKAGKVLGDEAVAVSTVRYWHATYVDGDGVLKPDERGHHTRELLIMEEDIQRKFVKWSLAQAKAEDLSVELAREYLNNQLLNSLEVAHEACCANECVVLSCSHQSCCVVQSRTLEEYKLKLPISASTTWRWMQAVSIYRDKFRQSYYNDKHQDPLVI